MLFTVVQLNTLKKHNNCYGFFDTTIFVIQTVQQILTCKKTKKTCYFQLLTSITTKNDVFGNLTLQWPLYWYTVQSTANYRYCVHCGTLAITLQDVSDWSCEEHVKVNSVWMTFNRLMKFYSYMSPVWKGQQWCGVLVMTGKGERPKKPFCFDLLGVVSKQQNHLIYNHEKRGEKTFQPRTFHLWKILESD